jgi:hypothetical protein
MQYHGVAVLIEKTREMYDETHDAVQRARQLVAEMEHIICRSEELLKASGTRTEALKDIHLTRLKDKKLSLFIFHLAILNFRFTPQTIIIMMK